MKLPGKLSDNNCHWMPILRREHITFYCQQVWLKREEMSRENNLLSSFHHLSWFWWGLWGHWHWFCWMSPCRWYILFNPKHFSFFWVGNTRSQSLAGWIGSMANEGRETSEGCYWSDDLLLGCMEVVENWNLENFWLFETATFWYLFVDLCRSMH